MPQPTNDFPEFRTFFGEVYKDQNGNPLTPFPWQERLAKRLCCGKWPDCISVPTASGKTAIIDIAMYALATQAELGHRRTAPRRIFFVVDRRVIVDEAYERAMDLACRLKQAKSGPLKHLADRLRMLAGSSDSDPLECYELRGGVYRNNNWVRTPLQPTVICSTVDQIGSRLLFRGYGVSPMVAPIHAAMAANDSLIVLDEAHCSNPFRQTIDSIRRFRDCAEEPVPSPFHFVVMSATPGQDFDPQKVVRLDDNKKRLDSKDPVLGPRLKASKPTKLLVASEAKGDQALDHLAEFIAKQAKAMVGDDVKAVGIIVNRVATARMIYEHLTTGKKADGDHDAVLLTGRMRPYDKDHTFSKWRDRIQAKPGRPTLDRPVFVVSTQCLEVGANLDFDALISECASLDALRQRFGRLNRLGHRKTAPGVIVVQKSQEKKSDDDPVYGATLSETWKRLKNKKVANKGYIDMGINAFDAIMEKSEFDVRSLCAEQPDAPIMLPAYIDCWVQTAPIPRPDPDVSLFLHGAAQSVPEIQVIWRADLDEHGSETQWRDTVSLCPPVVQECMPVQLHVLRRWWRGKQSESQDATDVEGTRSEDDGNKEDLPKRECRGLVWRGLEKSKVMTNPYELSPGDTLVLPVSAGGWDVLGYVPGSENGEATIDIAELVARPFPVLRIHERLKSRWSDWLGYQRLLKIVRNSDSDSRNSIKLLRATLRELAADIDCSKELKSLLEQLAADRRLSVSAYPDEEYQEQWSGMVLSGSMPQNGERTMFSDEDDTSSAGSRPVRLSEHNQAVAAMCKHLALLCGLSKNLCRDIQRAGAIHDFGKADPRFQAWLFAGNRRKAEAYSKLLAKSITMPRNAIEYETGRRKSGYPKGGRHELLSVRLAECDGVLPTAPDQRELILHLVASHHGRCRPFAPVIVDKDPERVSLQHEKLSLSASSATGMERLDSGAAERFWRVVRRHGWWGAAYLEAIMRLADWCVSEIESNKEMVK